MTFLQDTNACISILNKRNSSIARRLAHTKRAEIALCSIVKAELYLGAYKSDRPQANIELVKRFEDEFASFSFDDQAGRICGRVRADLEKRAHPIGPYDLLIASIALANNVTLVTHNTREFSRIAELKIQDWEIEPENESSERE